MKKSVILCITILFLIQAKAQVPNPGFEVRQADGSPANWRPGSFIVFPIDSNCVYQGWDSIRTSTHDAHSGSYAYEVRVATACGDAYSGNIKPNRYDSDSGFFDQRIPISRQPSAFTFYYKLFAVQGDLGLAEAFMEDEAGGATGEGIVQLPAAATWTKATLPIHYTVSDTGGYLRLNFRIHNAAGLHYGSRFLIDDIGQSVSTGVAGAIKTASLECFPSPAQNSIAVRLGKAVAGANALLMITNIAGRTVIHAAFPVPQDKTFNVDTRLLAPGLYYIKLAENGRINTGRFVK